MCIRESINAEYGERGCWEMAAAEAEEETAAEDLPPPIPDPDYQWSMWFRDGLRGKPQHRGFVTSKEDLDVCEEETWSLGRLQALTQNSQLRVLKSAPIQEYQDEDVEVTDQTDWTQQNNKSMRGWCFRIRTWKPVPKTMSPRHERVGAFGSGPTRFFTSSRVAGGHPLSAPIPAPRKPPIEMLAQLRDECGFNAFKALVRAAVEGSLRSWDDPNMVDAVVLHRHKMEATVEVWLPMIATTKEVRERLLRSIRRVLKNELQLTKDEYEVHVSKNDSYYGHTFDGDRGAWVNPLKKGTKEWFKARYGY
eukprot:TRINITY_DN10169_c0_g1_i1.p1 TRINITY_DN10169_c0_g1~~TRINITY_DN10169_c0_g1_i1.p1  ORF type:complete len:307 (+),score=73.54 TRINITY_DN10169_c0_g1_i1:86-1006(+)